MGILDGIMKEMTEKDVEKSKEQAKEITDDVISNSLYDVNTKKKTMEIDGPISTIITHALNVVYGKKTIVKDKDDLTTMPSMEDHAIDATIVASMMYLLKHKEDEKKHLYIYGVEEKDSVGELDKISKKMEEHQDGDRILYVANEGWVDTKTLVVSEWCRDNNVVLCTSLERLIAEVDKRMELVNG